MLRRKVFFGLSIIAALTACSPNEPTSPSPTPQQTASAPVVAASAASTAQIQAASAPSVQAASEVYTVRLANEPYPPFNIFNADNTFSGLEIDVLNAIAQNQHFQVKFKPYVWDLLFKNMKEDDVDMVGGGLVADEMDTKAVVISQPYMRSSDCVVSDDAALLQDWQNKKAVLVQSDELKDKLVKQYAAKKENLHESAKSQFEMLKWLAAKRYDVGVSDCTVLKYYMNTSFKEHQFAIQELLLPENDKSFDLVLGIRKDQTELLNKINAGIANIKKNGELDAILKKWQ